MHKNFNIPDELKGIAPSLATLGNSNPYTVPTEYFDSLSDELIAAVRLSDIPQEKNTYSIPPGYFDSFALTVLSKLKTETTGKTEVTQELEEIAPLLNVINNKNVYAIPANYFDSLNPLGQLSARTGKVISLKSNFKQLIHYAVASCVLFIIATSSFVYVRMHTRNIDKTLSIEQRLANLNEDDIISYLKYDHQAEDLTPATDLQENQFDNLLMNASDEEIEHFLDEGNDNDEKTVNGI